MAWAKPKLRLSQAEIREELAAWQQFDRAFFPDIAVENYSGLPIPQQADGFRWPIVAARRISIELLVEKMRQEFEVCVSNATYLSSVESERNATGSSYVVWARDQSEADVVNAGKTFMELEAERICGMTLFERLRLHFFNWWRRDEHLDLMYSATLCWGSRHPRGVPTVSFYEGGTREQDIYGREIYKRVRRLMIQNCVFEKVGTFWDDRVREVIC